MAAAARRPQGGGSTVITVEGPAISARPAPQSVEDRVRALLRKIQESAAFAETRGTITATVAQLSPKEAATYLYVEVIGNALLAGETRINDIADQAERLFDECGDTVALLEEDIKTATEHLLPLHVDAAVAAVGEYLSEWQDGIATTVDTATAWRAETALTVANDIRETLRTLDEQAERAVELGDRMDQTNRLLREATGAARKRLDKV